jgi:glyoxylase-like metal-dependent hydrolase (beta-lactamase superfamily II)
MPALFLAAALALAPDVHLIPGTFTPGSQPDGNTVVFHAPEGLIVVDTGRHAAHREAIVAFAREREKPVAAVLNTHWHLDHIGGNPALREAFPNVKVFASGALEGARKGFLARYRTQLEELIASTKDPEGQRAFRTEMALIDAGPKLAPDIVVGASGERTIAGRPLRLGFERAATEGDLWIFDPKTRVLVAGDLVTLPAPFLDTACPARWKAALDGLAAIEFETLVPGHGPVMTRKELERYRDAFGSLLTCAGSKAPKEECIGGWVEGVGSLVPAGEHEFTRMLMSYYVDLLRGDPAKAAALCGG